MVGHTLVPVNWLTTARSLVAASLAAALIACGGSSGDDEVTTAAPAVVQGDGVGALDDPTLLALTAAVAADVGEEAVFAAVALSLDRGYTVGQLAAAAGTGALSADGTIAGIAPAAEPFGLLADADGAVQSLRRLSAPTATSDELEQAVAAGFEDFDLSRDNTALAAVLAMLVEMGYSFDQVVEGLVFGEVTVRFAAEYESYSDGSELTAFRCIALVGGTGTIVRPADDRRGAHRSSSGRSSAARARAAANCSPRSRRRHGCGRIAA